MAKVIVFGCECGFPTALNFLNEKDIDPMFFKCINMLISGEVIKESINDLLHFSEKVKQDVYENLKPRVESGVKNIIIIGCTNHQDYITQIESALAKIDEFSKIKLWNLNAKAFLLSTKDCQLQVMGIKKRLKTGKTRALTK